MKRCSRCGRQLVHDARFCDWCGQSQPTSMPGPRWPHLLASGAPVAVIAIMLILIMASVPKVLVSQQYVTTTQTQSFTTTQFQTITVTQTIQTGAPSQLVEYCFSPGGNCGNVVIRWIDRANSSVHVLIYSFTLDNIGDALIRAKDRGLDVRVVFEKQQQNVQGGEWQRLKDVGVSVRIDGNSDYMHDKVAIIDNQIVVTGSFNWSAHANDENNENLIVLRDQAWAQAFEAHFTTIWNQAIA